MKFLTTFALAVLLSSLLLNAQQQREGADPSSDPVELPEVIVTGKESMEISGGSKQLPKRTAALTKAQLDSLNTIEKHIAIRLPVQLPPSLSMQKIYPKGYAIGKFGQYLTPKLTAGYDFSAGGYGLYAHGLFEASNGHIDNAEYNRWGIGASAEYVAPEKFIFFGGGKTQTFVELKQADYRLYGTNTAPERSMNDLKVGVRTDGNYNEFGYSMGADWSSVGMGKSAGEVEDNALHGFIGGKKTWNDWNVGADLDLRFHSFRGSAYNMMNVSASGEYRLSNIDITANVGLQSAHATTGATYGALRALGRLQCHLSEDFTVVGELRSGLLQNSFQEILRVNPYSSQSMDVNFARENIALFGRLWHHPSEKFSISASVTYRNIGNLPLWRSDTLGSFALDYKAAQTFDVEGEALWFFGLKDNISLMGRMPAVRLLDSDKSATYIPTLQAGLVWRRTWTDRIGTVISANYIGKRFSDENEKSLDGFVSVNFRATYTITSALQAEFRIDNAANSTIFLWDNYKERGIFFAAAVQWLW